MTPVPAGTGAPFPNIFQIGMHFDASAGGADRYFDGILAGFEKNHVPFTAAAFSNQDQPRLLSLEKLAGARSPLGAGRVSLGEARSNIIKRLRAVREFRRLVSRANAAPSVLATHFSLYALPAVSSGRFPASVVHFHGPWSAESAHEGQRWWSVAAKYLVERRVYGSARRLITLSEAFRNILIEKYAVSAHRISVIPGGVDTERFHPASQRNQVRKLLGWPEDCPIILCIRRMVQRMGIENLLEAFAKIAHTNPAPILVLGGKGPLREGLIQRAKQLGISRRVIFAGYIPEPKLPSAYAAADMSIVPSNSLEGFGLVVPESLACGTPVIVTPVGGLPETVRGFDKSLILGGSTPEDLEKGLRAGLAGRLPSRDACRDYALAHFDWRIISHQLCQIYRDVANDAFC